jgi:hypothetical protein
LCQFVLYLVGNCINLCQFGEGFLVVLLEPPVFPLPSLAKVGPTSGSVHRVRAENTWPMDISSSDCNTFALRSSHMIEVFIELLWIIAICSISYGHSSRSFEILLFCPWRALWTSSPLASLLRASSSFLL